MTEEEIVPLKSREDELLEKMDFYFDNMDRRQAEMLLQSFVRDTFLIRKSSVVGSFAVSVWKPKQAEIFHCLIRPTSRGTFQLNIQGNESNLEYPDVITLCVCHPYFLNFDTPANSGFWRREYVYTSWLSTYPSLKERLEAAQVDQPSPFASDEKGASLVPRGSPDEEYQHESTTTTQDRQHDDLRQEATGQVSTAPLTHSPSGPLSTPSMQPSPNAPKTGSKSRKTLFSRKGSKSSMDMDMHSALRAGNIRVLKALLQSKRRKVLLRTRDDRGLTPLAHAVILNNMDAVKLMLKTYSSSSKLDINEVDEQGNTLLHHITQEQSFGLSAFRILIQFKKLNAHAEDANGNTPLHYFCQNIAYDGITKSIDEVIGLLISRGARVNWVNSSGEGSVHRAVLNGNAFEGIDLLKALIKQNANIDLSNKCGETPLHYAVRLQRLGFVAFLLSQDEVDLEKCTSEGYSPLELARTAGNTPIANLLERELGKAENQKVDIFDFLKESPPPKPL